MIRPQLGQSQDTLRIDGSAAYPNPTLSGVACMLTPIACIVTDSRVPETLTEALSIFGRTANQKGFPDNHFGATFAVLGAC